MGQEESDKPAESRFPWQYWLLGALILYPLSVGPAMWLVAVFPSLEKCAIIFYGPIVYVYKNSPEAEKLINWYVMDLWRVPGP